MHDRTSISTTLAQKLLTRALVVALVQRAGWIERGLKPHLEPLFILRKQTLAEVRVIPHGHPVQHDDHHEDGHR